MDSGPYLNAALLCEKVLQEKDGVLSVVRVVDRVTLTAVSAETPAPEMIPPSTLAFYLLIVLKSGMYKGSAEVKLEINSPSGQRIGFSAVDAFFEGDDRGINLVSPVQFPVSEDGLYWIDVTCLNVLLTRIPLRVIYQRLSQGALPWPPTATR
jgi:hypothetical protein